MQATAASLAFTAGNIRAALIAEAYLAEPDYKDEVMEAGIQWTGHIQVQGDKVWFQYVTPGDPVWLTGHKGPDGYLETLPI